MKITVKRLLALVLGVAMIWGALPITASADGDFRVEEGALLEYLGPGGNITIPDHVSVIYDGVFQDKYGITGVAIGPKVKIIGDNAFRDCKDLVTVSIADAKVGDHAFDGCGKLKTVSIGAGKIGYAAFGDCVSLETVALGSGVTSIGESAFHDCNKLKAIEIPEGITEIPDGCFYKNYALADIKFPSTLKVIRNNAFNSVAVKRVYFYPGLESIGDSAFALANDLTDIWIPDSVTAIGYRPFTHYDSDPSAFFLKKIHGVSGSYAETFCDTDYFCEFVGDYNGAIDDPIDGPIDEIGIPKETVYDSSKGSVASKTDGTVTITPANGQVVDRVYKNGSSISFTAGSNGKVVLTGVKKTDIIRITFSKAAPVSFTDVPAGAWYEANVKAVAERGIIAGYGNGKFGPNDNVTISQTAKLAAAVHASLSDSDYDFSGGNPWYYPYYEYLRDLGSYSYLYSSNPEKPATRREFAEIMQVALSCLNSSELSYNTVENGAIPDMAYNSTNECVYKLYRAGIVVGDQNHNFNPTMNIARCEVAAIVHRFIDQEQRQSVTLTNGGSDTIQDLTGYTPTNWSWTRDGSEGYGLDKFTSGKYVRTDGKAVLYIESSDSPDFFDFQLYVMGDSVKGEWARPNEWDSGSYLTALITGSTASTGLEYFTDKGNHTISVQGDYEDTMALYYNMPDGDYILVREK